MKTKKGRETKIIEENAKDSPVKDIEWEAQELGVESSTPIESDLGTGQPIVLRFFHFSANPLALKERKPTAQELFESHRRGIESLLWADGFSPYFEIEPRLMFSKNKDYYGFVVAAIPSLGNSMMEKPQTLKEILK